MNKKKMPKKANGIIIKKFGGKRYRFDSWHKFKTDAKKRAKSLRQGKGVSARVVAHIKLGKWIVYVRTR